MVIQHNISAVNSYRQLNTNQNALSKNLEKLSSGYRINRAADDAAGLAISESMRSKINGLDQAEANANDAIGLIQTEEGALTETHSMLQRMTTLATQAANGTYSTEAEGKTARESIQKEVDELADEITRIADNTKYNGLHPLNAVTLATGGQVKQGTVSSSGAFTASQSSGDKFYIVDSTSTSLVYGAAYSSSSAASEAYTEMQNPVTDIQLQVGPTASETLQIKQTDMTFAGLFGTDNQAATGMGQTALAGAKDANTASGAKVLDMGSVSKANDAITRIQNAINNVSSYRADLGAKQNRLEHTINNLKTTNENVTAAESRIRDTDMAKEIAAYTKNNILSQAAQSMLAQANQSGQGVLTLLRG